MNQRLVICGKSPWLPSIRREHAFANEAAARGIATTFVESPMDARALRNGQWQAWVAGLTGHRSERDRVRMIRRSSPAPGHRHPVAARSDNALLHRILVAHEPITSLVVNAPWQWDATQGLAPRRVFDAADDWTRLIPARNAQLLRYYERIADEADEIIVANPALSMLFGNRTTRVVPNAVDSSLLLAQKAPQPRLNRLVYIGTLSERFDVSLVEGVLDQLPGWTLDLHGECRFAGSGQRPSPALAKLLADRPQQLRWHGLLARTAVAKTIDRADVFLLPDVLDRVAGQSSMKAFDCAARGRPMVTTPWAESAREMLPPHSLEAASAAGMAQAVLAAAYEPAVTARIRIDWARRQTWADRWPAWSAAVGVHSAPVVTS